MTRLLWLDQFESCLPFDSSGNQFLRLLGGPCSPLEVRIKVVDDFRVDTIELMGANPEAMIAVRPGLFAREPRSKTRQKREPDAYSSAGTMTAVARRSGEEVSRGLLQVRSANFTDTEYQQMLLEIGLAAVSSASWVQVPMRADVVMESDASQPVGNAFRRRQRVLEELISYVNAVCRSMQEVERRPLRSVRRQARGVPVRRALKTRQGVMAFTRAPGRQTVSQSQLDEDIDSPENRFLRWLIEMQLLTYLRIACARPEYQMTPDRDVIQMLERAAQRNPRLRGLANVAPELTLPTHHTLELLAAEHRLTNLMRGATLSRVTLIDSPQPPTERLLGTPGYREIYQEYVKSSWFLGPAVRRGLKVASAIVRREVRATWKCYELWCFIQLHRMFTDLAGFTPPEGERTLADLLEVHEGEVRLSRGSTLKLSRADTHVTMVYEPQLPSSRNGEGAKQASTLTPDILLTVRRGSQSAPWHIVFDAKYRDYAVQGASEREKDLWTTALLKYHNGISTAIHPSAIAIRASFILHSDPGERSPENDFWGGVPAEEWLNIGDERKCEAELLGVREHSVGLIRLRPDDDCTFQLGRLLDLLLQYVAPPQGHECPRCGTSLRVGREVRLEQEGSIKDLDHEVRYIGKARREGWATSLVCQCRFCGHLWFQNHCQSKGHPLFKYGARSFHHASRKPWQTGGMYICPKCGDDPGPDDVNRKVAEH